eukprot:scaffold204757_cov39-Prasinocladus_malaysianus.AAC.1
MDERCPGVAGVDGLGGLHGRMLPADCPGGGAGRDGIHVQAASELQHQKPPVPRHRHGVLRAQQ